MLSNSKSRKPQYKDVYWKTIEILQRAHIFKGNCCLKVHDAHLNLASKSVIPHLSHSVLKHNETTSSWKLQLKGVQLLCYAEVLKPTKVSVCLTLELKSTAFIKVIRHLTVA